MPYTTEELEDHVRGLVYGNAIGDAIGLLTEFMVKTEAKKYYGDKKELLFDQKVPDMHRERWKRGDWTDDTDQMILIMQSIIEKKKVSAVDFALRLKSWARKGFPELGDFAGMGIGATTSKVINHAKFHEDPHKIAADVWEKTGRVVAPNGAIMRTSVLGAFEYDNLDSVQKNTLEIGKVTHADPRCQASVVAMTTAIALMLQRQPQHLKKDGSYNIPAIMNESFDAAIKLLPDKSLCKELKQHVFPSLFSDSLSKLKLDEYKKIGYTYKCLGAGFWALRQNDFQEALQKIVMEAGDADTNGAVAGALLGCKLGAKKLPASWLNALLHKEWLDKIIDSFLPLVLKTETSEILKKEECIDNTTKEESESNSKEESSDNTTKGEGTFGNEKEEGHKIDK